MKTETTIEKQFKEDCRVVSMDSEYPGHHEEVKWIVYSDLSEGEIKSKYGELLEQYMPCMFLSMDFYTPVRIYHNNERKHRRRMEDTYDNYSYLDGEYERFHQELSYEMSGNEEKEDLHSAINGLPDLQRERVIQYYFCGASCDEIAEQEGINKATVSRSLKKALRNLKNSLTENE